MGRNTGTAENTQYNNEMAGIQRERDTRSKQAEDWFIQGEKDLSGGKMIGANPYTNPDYLRNQNILTAASTSAANKSGKEALDTEATRTGTNTAARKATLADLSRASMRTGTEYQAGRAADDYDRNLDWQRFLLGSRLAPAGVDTTMFGQATSGRSSATKNLADIGIASNQAFGQIMGSLIGAAGGVATGFTPKGRGKSG
jgi:hypothetical protein